MSSFLPSVRTINLNQKPSVTEEEARLIWLSAKKISVSILIKLLWFTGLRITEALNLKASDVIRDGFNFSIQVMTEKVGKLETSKPDILPLPRNMGLELYDYIKTSGIKPSEKLFDMHRSTAWRQIQRCAKDAGLSHWKEIHPHSFRHGFIYDKASKGVQPYLLSKLARHRELNTTLGYYQPTENDMRQAMEL